MRKDVTTREMLIDWFKECPKNKRWLVVMCDTYEHSDYPVYCDAKEALKRRDTDGHEMQSVMECYDTKMDMKTQMNQRRCFNWPSGSDLPAKEILIVPKVPTVSSEETNALVTYCVDATTGHVEHESTFKLQFQFNSNKILKYALSDFVEVLRKIVLEEMANWLRNTDVDSCCTKHLKTRKIKYCPEVKYCPDCGTKLSTVSNKPEPEDVLEAYNTLFCRDFVLNHELFDKLEAQGVQLWCDHEGQARLVTVSGIDYLVAGIKDHTTIKVADVVIGKRVKLSSKIMNDPLFAL